MERLVNKKDSQGYSKYYKEPSRKDKQDVIKKLEKQGVGSRCVTFKKGHMSQEVK